MDIRGLELKTLHHMHKPCNTAHLETADEPSMLLKTCISGERFNNYIRVALAIQIVRMPHQHFH